LPSAGKQMAAIRTARIAHDLLILQRILRLLSKYSYGDWRNVQLVSADQSIGSISRSRFIESCFQRFRRCSPMFKISMSGSSRRTFTLRETSVHRSSALELMLNMSLNAPDILNFVNIWGSYRLLLSIRNHSRLRVSITFSVRGWTRPIKASRRDLVLCWFSCRKRGTMRR
jgi:hypothetical protein